MPTVRVTLKKSEELPRDLVDISLVRHFVRTKYDQPDLPLGVGSFIDVEKRCFFEFEADDLGEVQKSLDAKFSELKLEVTNGLSKGEECADCGNITGGHIPTVCPTCGFRDIDPCPLCGEEISRMAYDQVRGSLFQCPNCQHKVRMKLNPTAFKADGRLNSPAVVLRAEPNEGDE